MLGKEIQLKAPGVPRCSFSKQPPICLKHTTFWALLPLIIALSLQSDISSSISTARHSFNCLHVPHYLTVSLFLPLALETIRLWGLLASNLRFLLQPICLPPRTGPNISITGLHNSLREQGINQWSTGSSNPKIFLQGRHNPLGPIGTSDSIDSILPNTELFLFGHHHIALCQSIFWLDPPIKARNLSHPYWLLLSFLSKGPPAAFCCLTFQKCTPLVSNQKHSILY